MSAPNWLVTAHPNQSRGGGIAHAVADGVPLCRTGRVTKWRAPKAGESHCPRCVVATSPAVVTHVEMVKAGITYRQLDFWVRRGYLRCVRPAQGSGSQRLFSRDEVTVASVMARLVAAGVSPEAAERVARTGFLADGLRVLVTDPVDIEAVA